MHVLNIVFIRRGICGLVGTFMWCKLNKWMPH